MPRPSNGHAPQTRASFVKSLPIDMPADEVIARGKRVGIDIKRSNVNAARFEMRHGPGTGKQKRAVRQVKVVPSSMIPSSTDDQLRKLMIRAGTARAREVLEEVELLAASEN